MTKLEVAMNACLTLLASLHRQQKLATHWTNSGYLIPVILTMRLQENTLLFHLWLLSERDSHCTPDGATRACRSLTVLRGYANDSTKHFLSVFIKSVSPWIGQHKRHNFHITVHLTSTLCISRCCGWWEKKSSQSQIVRLILVMTPPM